MAGSRWSRSRTADVERALVSLARGSRSWFEESTRWRWDERGYVGRAGREVAPVLGLDEDEAFTGTDRAVRIPERAAGPGVAVLRRSWSEGPAGLAAAARAELSAGRTLLLLTDGRAPSLAASLAEELLDAGVPGSALALVCDDGDVALRTASQCPEVTRVALSGHEEDEARLARVLERARAAAGFGAGVVVTAERDVHFERLAPPCARVELDEDPQRAAAWVARAAFGRARLSGQAANQLGRVEVHPRRLSRFTAALLEELEERGVADPPVGPVERDLPAFLERVRALGLDEGATLVHEARVGSPTGGPGGRIVRLVFTNAEPRMRSWGLARPAPVLLLSRLTDGDPR